MFTSLLHHPVVFISHKAHSYIDERERERIERKVKDKEMHIRNIDIENGDYFIQRVSRKCDIIEEPCAYRHNIDHDCLQCDSSTDHLYGEDKIVFFC